MSPAQTIQRPFTITDEIGLTHFFEMGKASDAVSFSPDGNYFAVWTERGRLDLNRVEDSLRFYRSRDVAAFLKTSEEPPSPIWVISRLGETGGVIDKWQWLPHSEELAFLQRIDDLHRRLVLADLAAKSVQPLTHSTENVDAFEVQDRQHYTYTTEARAPVAKTDVAASVGTGHTLQELILGDKAPGPSRIHFWKVAGGKRFELKQSDARVLQIQNPGQHPQTKQDGLDVIIEQGLDGPPVLVAKNGQSSRMLWDPNPQLKMLDLGQARVYTWKDKNGRERRAGLYKPSDYKRGKRYPLVIQTHDFHESRFSPSGSILTSSYAARTMASAGIVVLQVAENCPSATANDGPCAVSAYESAINQLISDGIADPERVGIVAFSWPSFYVMDLLTTGNAKIKAALIATGQFMGDYFQDMALADSPPDPEGKIRNSAIGALPFGDGLQDWLKNSPSFHLDRISTPLLMVAQGRWDVLLMWAPYAGLHYLHKPVDLIMLKTTEHNLTNPRMRLESQDATVDWFRFWLQDYEDPTPAKVDQYKRWRELRKTQPEEARKNDAQVAPR